MSANRLTQPLKRAATAAGKPQSFALGPAFITRQEKDGQSPPASAPNPRRGQPPTRSIAVQLNSPSFNDPGSLSARTLSMPAPQNISHQLRLFSSTSSGESVTQSLVSPYKQLALRLEVYYNNMTLDLQALTLTTSYETLGKGEMECLAAIGVVGGIIPLMKTAFPSREETFFRELCNAMDRLESTIVANKRSITQHHVDFEVLLEDVGEMQKALGAFENETDMPLE